MKLPAVVLAIRDRYVPAFLLWSMPPGPAADERARGWSIRFAEQVAFEQPGQGWGMKRADPTRPISKDTIARLTGDDHLLIWDLLSGAGTGSPTLVANPDSEDVTGQTFVPVVPFDHLGTTQSPPPVPPVPPDADPRLTQILVKLDALAIDVHALAARPAPSYTGHVTIRLLGTAPITLTPLPD